MSSDIIIRPIEHVDIGEVSSLARHIWEKHYINIISQAQIDYMLEMMYSPASLQKQLAESHQFYLALLEDRIIGYMSVQETAPREWSLHKFYIDGEQQRRGIGRRMLAYVEQAKHPAILRLTVNRTNVHAINFYFKHGFTIEYAKDFDIGGGFFMNDFVMVKHLAR